MMNINKYFSSLKLMISQSLPLIVFLVMFSAISFVPSVTKEVYLSNNITTLMILIDRYLILSFLLSGVLIQVFSGLKETYMWNSNKSYKYSIQISAFSILLITNGILLLFWYWHGQYKFLVFVIAILISLNSINHKKISTFVILISPILLFSNISFGFSLLSILVFFILFYSLTLGVGCFLYIPEKAKSPKNKVNNFIIFKVENLIYNSNKTVDLALAKPAKLLAIPAIMFALFLISFYLLMYIFDDKEIKTIFSIVFIFFLNVLILIEMQFNIRQVQSFAHVFSGSNHEGIKKKIVKSMDKTLLINNIVFIFFMLLLLFIIDINVDYLRFIVSMFVMLIVVYSTYLFLMSAGNLSKKTYWFTITITYGLLIFVFQDLIQNHINKITTLPYVMSILAIASLMRWFSQRLFMKVPFEKLIKFSN